MAERPTFVYPNEEYMKGLAQTMAAYYYLNDEDTDYEHFTIDVYEQVTDKYHGKHQLQLTMEDYPELVKDKILKIKDL